MSVLFGHLFLLHIFVFFLVWWFFLVDLSVKYTVHIWTFELVATLDFCRLHLLYKEYNNQVILFLNICVSKPLYLSLLSLLYIQLSYIFYILQKSHHCFLHALGVLWCSHSLLHPEAWRSWVLQSVCFFFGLCPDTPTVIQFQSAPRVKKGTNPYSCQTLGKVEKVTLFSFLPLVEESGIEWHSSTIPLTKEGMEQSAKCSKCL